jgi:hypothetical protein
MYKKKIKFNYITKLINNNKKKFALTYIKVLVKSKAFSYVKPRRTLRLIKKLYFSHFKKKVFNLLILRKRFIKKVVIKAVQNNFFCSLIDLKDNKTLHLSSAGIYKIKVSKRKFKKVYKNFLKIFFHKIRKHLRNLSNVVFVITAPIRIRRKIFKLIKPLIKPRNTRFNKKKFILKKKKTSNVLISIVPKKCFNGCRVQKKVRKKRRLYRIFKV